jgi:hypothetical protein
MLWHLLTPQAHFDWYDFYVIFKETCTFYVISSEHKNAYAVVLVASALGFQ